MTRSESIVTLTYLLVFILLLYATMTDIKSRLVDDWVSVGILILGVGTSVISGAYYVFQSLLWGIVTFTVLFIVYMVGIKKNTCILGGGDIKLLSALALVYRHQIIDVIILACIIGAVYGILIGIKNKTYLETTVPFVPAIFVACIVQTLFVPFSKLGLLSVVTVRDLLCF